MPNWMKRLCLVAVAGQLTACAAIFTGTDQDIAVTSEPAGAKCTLSRKGETVARIAATPSTVNVDKSWSDLHITCEKNGYVPDNAKLDSEFQVVTMGNVLIGGLIGLTVDAATGAMRKYPEEHFTVLIPGSFESRQAANDYFDQLSVLVKQRNKDDDSGNLKKKLRMVENRRNIALQRLQDPVPQTGIAQGKTQQSGQDRTKGNPAYSGGIDPFFQPFLI